MIGARALAWVVLLAAAAQAQEADRVQGRTPSEWLGLMTYEQGLLVSTDPSLDEGDVDDAVDALTEVCEQAPARALVFRAAVASERTREVAWMLLGRLARSAGRHEGEDAAPLRAALRSPKTIAAASTALGESGRETRSGACRVLVLAGAAARSAVPALAEAIRDEAWGGRFEAAWALAAIGGPGAVKALAYGLAQDDSVLARASANGLGDLGPAAAEAVPDLIQALEEGRPKEPLPVGVLDFQPSLRAEAALALGKIGAPAAAAVPDLIEALESRDEHLPRCAAISLGRFGAAAESALPRLQKLAVEGRDRATQGAAEAAIRAILEASR